MHRHLLMFVPRSAAFAVIDGVTKRPIPAIDPNNPDPLNSVNVTVVNSPNARSSGGCRRSR